MLNHADLSLLQHVNCSYLSSDTAPTLLALKKHAQSLTKLIRKLTVSSHSVPIGVRSDLLIDHEAFDWLVDLDKPYDNADESHHLPLWSLVNHVNNESETADGTRRIEHHCPLKKAHDFGPLAQAGSERRPYLSHHSLVMHANECLEILDHEYSASGGLISILPREDAAGSAEMIEAGNTLLGQWLYHHQHLVGRMHELEINYANALDLLAGEADVPLQIAARNGPDGRSKGREIAFLQDRYVLVNAGDDVFGHIHRQMDQTEAQISQKEAIWKSHGATGERLWKTERGGDWYARGLVPVDILTRFYRIKEKGHGSTIFVLPAIEQHPGLRHTRKMENRPTVVSVVTPTWPERVSEWERKSKARLDRATELEVENRSLVRKRLEMQDALALKEAELRKSRQGMAFFETTMGLDEKDRMDSLLQQVMTLRDKLDQLRDALPNEFHSLLDVDI